MTVRLYPLFLHKQAEAVVPFTLWLGPSQVPQTSLTECFYSCIFFLLVPSLLDERFDRNTFATCLGLSQVPRARAIASLDLI